VCATLTDEREWGDKMKEGRRKKKEMGRINKQIEAFFRKRGISKVYGEGGGGFKGHQTLSLTSSVTRGRT
jgi:hypothetical protein